MKAPKKLQIVLLVTVAMAFQSCRIWQKIFPPKYGCPTNGKNVGAEQLLEENTKKKKKKTAKFNS